MDPVVNQLARDLVDAISAAVGGDGRVETCREKAREAGYDLTLSLEAAIGFISRAQGTTTQALAPVPPTHPPMEMTANDRRFLKSLRISADETEEKEVE